MGKGEPSRARQVTQDDTRQELGGKGVGPQESAVGPPEQRNQATGRLSPLPGGEGAAPLSFVDGVH